MGIRNLNRYLRNNCPESIRCIPISDISHKKIAIDISIYLYKFESENALLENMFMMLSIFRHYNIIPIFIFDGKPPDEKKALLKKRKEDKKTAQEEYYKLEQSLQDKQVITSLQDKQVITSLQDKQNIIAKMVQLKKQFVQINKEKIENVKSLIRAYGATYYDAPGEADELCALLVIKKKVWACLSEDMDLFVYGCSRVLRYFSLLSHTVVLYFTKGIFNELNMTYKDFKEICILSGTDYNINTNNKEVNLNVTIEYFNNFKKSDKSDNSNNTTFYDWLQLNTDYIYDIHLLNKINNMFNLDCNNETLNNIFNNIKIINGPIKQEEIENIMKSEDFIFL
jgi:flap endonuclease-1